MNFGEKLRKLRSDRDFKQPELAEAIGIEQSYLSKLETGKSVPSADVFARILDVFELSVGELVDDLDQSSRRHLRKIPAVATHFSIQQEAIIGSRRRWLLVACVTLAVGVGLFYGGLVEVFVPNTVYQYQSDGVVLEGESKDVFRLALHNYEIPNDPEAGNRRAGLEARRNEDFLATRKFRGTVFNVRVNGGSRTYYLEREVETDSWINKAASTLGILLASLGSILLVAEKKLARYQ